jgi:hypothetical protein
MAGDIMCNCRNKQLNGSPGRHFHNGIRNTDIKPMRLNAGENPEPTPPPTNLPENNEPEKIPENL